MTYIHSMKNLGKFEEKKKILNSQRLRAQNTVKKIESMLALSERTEGVTLPEKANSLAFSYDRKDPSPHLTEFVKNGCNDLEIEFSYDIRKETSEYESRASQICLEASDQIEKGREKPLSQSVGKIMGLLWSGCAALAFLVIMPVAFSSMMSDSLMKGENISGIFTMLGLASLLIFFSIIFHKKKPNEQLLSEMDSELMRLTKNYVGFISPIFAKALAALEAKIDSAIEGGEAELREELGENIMDLYESIPYRQREYFRNLGMTASCEADFNKIAMECHIAEKKDAQIDLQNYQNAEARREMSEKLEQINKTARQIHEDANLHAARMEEQNRQIAQQNELNLKNQSKAIEEIKKNNQYAADLEYQIRNRK